MVVLDCGSAIFHGLPLTVSTKHNGLPENLNDGSTIEPSQFTYRIAEVQADIIESVYYGTHPDCDRIMRRIMQLSAQFLPAYSNWLKEEAGADVLQEIEQADCLRISDLCVQSLLLSRAQYISTDLDKLTR